MLAGFWLVINSVYTSKFEIATNQIRFETKIDGVATRMDKYEKTKETWGFQDMFKWAVHLQRDNPTMKVPEPDNKEQ